MSLTSETIFEFNRAAFRITHPDSRLRSDGNHYDEALSKVVEEVGDVFDLREAVSLCLMGFFITHTNFDGYESMHAYDGQIYYEDGANVSAAGIINNPPDWMESGWKIKATPDKVNFAKLQEMHKSSNGLMLQGKSYDDCIIKNEQSEKDWLDDVLEHAHNKDEVWFTRDNELIEDLYKYICHKSRKATVMWGLSIATDIRDKLSKASYKDRRPLEAIQKVTDWAFGRCSTKVAKKALNACEAMYDESTTEIDKLYISALVEALRVVQKTKHAIKVPMYELTAVAKINGVGDCGSAILERKKFYIEKMEFCESQVSQYANLANFVQ